MEIIQIKLVYERSKTYALASDVEERITGSTLAPRTLKFLVAIIETADPMNWMEFGSGLFTFFTARLLSGKPRAHI